MTAILGISAFYHDSAAAIIVDGEIVAAAQEERFSRKKHDPTFPTQAVAYCLREAGLGPGQVDYVAYYEKPLLKFERLLETYLAYAPWGFRSFSMAMAAWLKDKVHLRRVLRQALPAGTTAPILFADHHQSHAASAFFPSPFEEAAILTVDGVGEWSTTAWGVGRGNELQLTEHVAFPHSLGLLYSAFTYYCGFKVNSGEYKLMGLAPFGRPVYQDAIYRRLIDLKPDGSFWLDMKYFNYCAGLTMTGRRFHALFGGPPRRAEAQLDQRHMDLAASIQAVTEEVILRIGRHVHARTKMKHLALAGGVALNCVANARLLREGPFESIWVQPAAGDAGGALGAALLTWYQLLRNRRSPAAGDSQKGSLLGPSFSPEYVHRLLAARGILPSPSGRGVGGEGLMSTTPTAETPSPPTPLPPGEGSGVRAHVLLRDTAELLANESVVGWFQGRMEYGPRALGNRSILGDPRSPRMQSVMNQKIKFRESFRPFAPAVLLEEARDWFDLPGSQDSPYMLLVAPVRAERLLPLSGDQLAALHKHPDLNARLNLPRSTIPAVTHVDASARVQTVDRDRNPKFHDLLRAFAERTGCPVLMNTSFNIRGEPIVCTPDEALDCFLCTDMDALVLENVLLRKADVAHLAPGDREGYASRFKTD